MSFTNYAYDAVGNRLSRQEMIDGQTGATLNYTVDNLNRLTSLSESGTGGTLNVNFTYDAASQLTNMTRAGQRARP